jgi:hypothetical protein
MIAAGRPARNTRRPNITPAAPATIESCGSLGGVPFWHRTGWTSKNRAG